MNGNIVDTKSKDGVAPSKVNVFNEWPILVAVLIITFAYRFYFIRFFDVMSADGTGYALSGKGFLETLDPHSFGTLQPPLYPFFVGIFYLALHDLELAARAVSVVFSTLTIVPLYVIAMEFYGKMAAFCVTLLFMTLPFIHGMSGIDIPEPTYTFFALAGAYLFWRGFARRKPVFFSFAGILLGLSYLARPEGFIISFTLTILFVGMGLYSFGISTGIKRMALFSGAFWCCFAIMALPYINYLHSATGKWQLSGKTGLNSNIIREYRGNVLPDQHLRLGAQGEYAGGGDATLIDLIKNEPELFWGNIRDNLKALPQEFSSTFPCYLWPFVLIGFLAYPWHDKEVGMRLVLAGTCAPLALYVLYFVQARGFYAYVPVLLVLVGGGGVKIESWLRRIVPRPAGQFPIILPVVLLLSAYFVYSELPLPKPSYHYEQDGGRYDDKQIGMRLRTLVPETAIIMTRSGRIAFYSQRANFLPPQGTLEEILTFAKEKNVSYLIATLQVLNMRPQLGVLFEPLRNPGGRFIPPYGMELVCRGEEPGGLPYLVYRLH